MGHQQPLEAKHCPRLKRKSGLFCSPLLACWSAPLWVEISICKFLSSLLLVSQVNYLWISTLPAPHIHGFLIRCPPACPVQRSNELALTTFPIERREMRACFSDCTRTCFRGSGNLVNVTFFKQNPLESSPLFTSMQFASWKSLSQIPRTVWDSQVSLPGAHQSSIITYSASHVGVIWELVFLVFPVRQVCFSVWILPQAVHGSSLSLMPQIISCRCKLQKMHSSSRRRLLGTNFKLSSDSKSLLEFGFQVRDSFLRPREDILKASKESQVFWDIFSISATLSRWKLLIVLQPLA